MADQQTASTPARLEGRGLSCVRDDRVLFTDLGFGVSEGEMLLIEGRNGTGKTTLLRVICSIRRPDTSSGPASRSRSWGRNTTGTSPTSATTTA
ncbi:MAG: ATP-binding cassette domain-containing protein [Gammaproteobacteria bacterium]|nr:ATP-binding cassette domain-containing protein [Gammaproteobacteria bacterium]